MRHPNPKGDNRLFWTDQTVELLYRRFDEGYPDEEIAELIGAFDAAAVARRRRQLGLFRKEMGGRTRTAKIATRVSDNEFDLLTEAAAVQHMKPSRWASVVVANEAEQELLDAVAVAENPGQQWTRKWTPELDEEVGRLWGEGVSDTEIGEALGGLTPQAVQTRRSHLGFVKQRFWDDARDEELAELFHEGLSDEEIVESLGGSTPQSVKARRARLGLVRRRARVKEADRRDRAFNLYLTPDEKENVVAAATADGLKAGTWARQIALSEAAAVIEDAASLEDTDFWLEQQRQLDVGEDPKPQRGGRGLTGGRTQPHSPARARLYPAENPEHEALKRRLMR